MVRTRRTVLPVRLPTHSRRARTQRISQSRDPTLPRRDGSRLRLLPPPLSLPSLAPRRGDYYPLPATTRAVACATPRHPALPVPRAILVCLAPLPRARSLALDITANLLPGLLRATALVSLPCPTLVPPESRHGDHPPTPSSLARASQLRLLSPRSPSRARPPRAPALRLLVLPYRSDATAANTRRLG
ncbi:hypothetical protein Efla_000537 [Eimeria flavescens]